jgi:hypothetical protein
LVESADPFHRIVEPARKPEPFTVRVNADPPAVAELGLRLEMLGVGTVIVNVAALEVKPPGLTTVTVAVPALEIRLAATVAVSCVAPPNIVGSGDPFHCTVAPDTNPAPFTVSVKAGPPAVDPFGPRLVIIGALTAADS